MVGGMASVKYSNGDHNQLLWGMRGHSPRAWRIIIYCLLPRLVRCGGGSGLLVGLAEVCLPINTFKTKQQDKMRNKLSLMILVCRFC